MFDKNVARRFFSNKLSDEVESRRLSVTGGGSKNNLLLLIVVAGIAELVKRVVYVNRERLFIEIQLSVRWDEKESVPPSLLPAKALSTSLCCKLTD